jgi:hypothetical protein
MFFSYPFRLPDSGDYEQVLRVYNGPNISDNGLRLN